MVDSLRCYFTFLSFQQIPRVDNKVGDATSLLQLEKHESKFEFMVEEIRHPIYDFQESHVICTLVGYSFIYSYLHDEIILDTFN